MKKWVNTIFVISDQKNLDELSDWLPRNEPKVNISKYKNTIDNIFIMNFNCANTQSSRLQKYAYIETQYKKYYIKKIESNMNIDLYPYVHKDNSYIIDLFGTDSWSEVSKLKL